MFSLTSKQFFRINLQLEAELALERSSVASRNITAQSNEISILRQELEVSREMERQLNEQLDQINVAFDSVRFV